MNTSPVRTCFAIRSHLVRTCGGQWGSRILGQPWAFFFVNFLHLSLLDTLFDEYHRFTSVEKVLKVDEVGLLPHSEMLRWLRDSASICSAFSSSETVLDIIILTGSGKGLASFTLLRGRIALAYVFDTWNLLKRVAIEPIVSTPSNLTSGCWGCGPC